MRKPHQHRTWAFSMVPYNAIGPIWGQCGYLLQGKLSKSSCRAGYLFHLVLSTKIDGVVPSGLPNPDTERK